MFHLKFGLILTVFITFAFSFSYFNDEVNLDILPIMVLFEGIGVWMIILGVKSVITNKRTDIYGINTYGIILKISETGCYLNEMPELQAKILAYLPNEGTTKIFKEIVGIAPIKYDEGDFLLLNQHEKDINIIQKTDKNYIPNQILDELKSQYEKNLT